MSTNQPIYLPTGEFLALPLTDVIPTLMYDRAAASLREVSATFSEHLPAEAPPRFMPDFGPFVDLSSFVDTLVQSASAEFGFGDSLQVFNRYTVSVNRPVKEHEDTLNKDGTLGALTVFYFGDVEGGEFELPDKNIVMRLEPRDVLVANLHARHAVRPVRLLSPDAKKISVAFYVR